MPFNLIDAAKNMIPQDLITKAAGSAGESEQGISKALTAAIPAVLMGLLGRNASGGSTALLSIVKDAAGNNAWSNMNSLLGNTGSGGLGSTVMGWLRSLFGDRLGKITDAVAGFAGIKSSSASTVLNMAAPATLGSLGKYVQENNLTAAGLSSFLQSQQSMILGSVPGGMDIAGTLGMPGIITSGEHITASFPTHRAAETVKKTNAWIWLTTLLVAMLLIWLLSGRSCNQQKLASGIPVIAVDTPVAAPPAVATPTYRSTGIIDTVSGDFVYDQGEDIVISLPNNTGDLKAGKWSTEAKLVEFLTNSSARIDEKNGNWFDFTNVRFKTGGTVMTTSSSTQLQNLVMILRAFPNAVFKIGGYTDNTGDAEKNLLLSQQRADFITAELIRLGASRSQLTGSEGYGDKYPAADNETAEGRAMNRRVAVNVKAK
ncbi:OmpA family protein [Terrimonas sp. NA20]|uniref:OmpA family protein n=1 Tax=Terrimonas ginsenosidimutans TaxID=2908004 RepID=A0ABS9KXN9_9BACT|nr:OmpA family protein [Terrimonas ginsenosidimutans]MCG2617104.1 OmpA family protein [Terrimonas ginsenosidimutans]